MGWGLNGVGAGIRAAGASLLGGLILPEELDNLSIEHALPIELVSCAYVNTLTTFPLRPGKFSLEQIAVECLISRPQPRKAFTRTCLAPPLPPRHRPKAR